MFRKGCGVFAILMYLIVCALTTFWYWIILKKMAAALGLRESKSKKVSHDKK